MRRGRGCSGGSAVVARSVFGRGIEFPGVEFERGEREPERRVDARLERNRL